MLLKKKIRPPVNQNTIKNSTTLKTLYPSTKELFEKISNERMLEQQIKKTNIPKERNNRIDSKRDLLKELGINFRIIKPLKESNSSVVTKFSPIKRVDEQSLMSSRVN